MTKGTISFLKQNWMLIIISTCVILYIIFRIHDTYYTQYISNERVATFLDGVAMSTLAAVIIGMTLEHASRTRLMEIMKKKVARISEDVFSGVYGIQFPKPYVIEVIDNCFGSPFIRSNCIMTYTLKNILPSKGKHVELEAVASFQTKNMGTNPQVVKFGAQLPNPHTPSLNSYVCVKYFKYGPSQFDLKEVDEATIKDENDIIQNKLKDEKKRFVDFNCGESQLAPGEIIHIEFSYSMVKEDEDTEILTTKSPMDGLRLTILNDTGQDYLIQSATLHREDFTAPTSGYNVKLHNFAFKHFFLPQQGVRLWWKKRENPTETS